ncbi:MAG: hypothetical protein RL220_1253 [Bacteroidota bacterium]
MREMARELHGETVLLTFYPHPRMVLHKGDHGLRLLTSLDEKKSLLESAGVDHLVIYPFSEDFSRMSAFEYVRDLLVNGLHTHTLVVGYDHRFGRNREGDFQVLQELSDVFGFNLIEIPAQKLNEIEVSSTKIRQALMSGDVETADEYLGYSYSITGEVVRGDGRGRKLGFPTANIRALDPHKLIPSSGVYKSDVQIDNKPWPCVVNIGVRPTVSDSGEMTIEAHIPGFDGDLYGKNITVCLKRRIRDEKKFGSVHELIQQINDDIATALL